MLNIVEDVLSREIEVAKCLYSLLKLTAVYGVLCTSRSILHRVFPGMQINSRPVCSLPS